MERMYIYTYIRNKEQSQNFGIWNLKVLLRHVILDFFIYYSSIVRAQDRRMTTKEEQYVPIYVLINMNEH